MKTTFVRVMIVAGALGTAACAAQTDEEPSRATTSAYTLEDDLGYHGGLDGDVATTTVTCPDGSIATGIHGRSGIYVDTVGLVCSWLNADGTVSQKSFDTPWLHVTKGGTNFRMLCQNGAGVMGLEGSSGALLDAITIVCKPVHVLASPGGGVADVIGDIMGRGALDTPSTLLPAAGGTGGGGFDDRCSAGYWLTSLSGRPTWVMQGIRGRCAKPQPGTTYH